MPTYDYKCPHCGCRFEIRVPVDKSDVVTCPECGVFADRQPSAPAFSLKGTGFYKNDYPKEKPSASDK